MAKKELNVYAVIWISTVAGALLSAFLVSEKELGQFLQEKLLIAAIAATVIIVLLIVIAKMFTD